VSEAQEIFLGQ